MSDVRGDSPFEVPLAHPFSLAGRHALVAGGASEPGRALAVALAEAGATVSVTTAHDDPAEETVAHSISNECWSMGREGAVHRLDLTDPAAVAAAVDALEREVAPLDILVNAAHRATIMPLAEASLDDWHGELAGNATPVFLTCRAVGPRMAERGYGRIINLVSVLHDRGLPNGALYGASQAAVYGLTRSLGLEWGRAGVRVNALGMGFIDGIPGPHQNPALHAVLERYIPLRRLGTVQDLRGALVYLAGEAAAFIDSEILVVDGAIQTHA